MSYELWAMSNICQMLKAQYSQLNADKIWKSKS